MTTDQPKGRSSFDSDADYRHRLTQVIENRVVVPVPEIDALFDLYPEFASAKSRVAAAVSQPYDGTLIQDLCASISLAFSSQPEQRLRDFERGLNEVLAKCEAAVQISAQIQELLEQFDESCQLKEDLARILHSCKLDPKFITDLQALCLPSTHVPSLMIEAKQILMAQSVSAEVQHSIAALFDQYSLPNKLKRHPDLQSRLALLTQYTTSKWLLERELKSRGEIPPDDGSSDCYEVAKKVKAVGLCFSGGGIRSATFNLGILQGLAQLKKLGGIAYLSSVSGGGYIHQFLASWIDRDKLSWVQRSLAPIPESGSGRIIPPEPIRWLRRYSNYLAPSVSMFGADIWTIATVWVRNTLLNLVILISSIAAILLIPHSMVTIWALQKRTLESFYGRMGVFLLLIAVALGAALLLWHSFPRFCAKEESDGTQPDRPCRKDYTRKWHVYAIVLAWLVVAVSLSSVVYKLSIPAGSQFSGQANEAYTPVPKPAQPTGQVTLSTTGRSTTAQWTVCKDDKKGCNLNPDASGLRLHHAWKQFKPDCGVPSLLVAWIPCKSLQDVYVSHDLVRTNSWQDESALLWLYETFPLLCLLFCYAVWFAHKETARGWQKFFSYFYPLAGGLFGAALIFGVECLFFAASFIVGQKLITALGIALVPPLILAVPFISLELCTGLMGTLFGSAQREWIARLRAVSIQVAVLWFALFGISLLGPYLFELIAHQIVVQYAVWSAWVVTTISGVVLGKSRSTSGKPKSDPETSGTTKGTTSSGVSELVIKIAPPVFIIGLLLLLSTYIGWVLTGPDPNRLAEPTMHWAALLIAVVAAAVVFSYRIDINEFSMNAFYRDRLARCYAGASNPARTPNLFTGFDVEDGRLRVRDLLPRGWTGLKGSEPGRYEGPFPIFSTALNVTTGRELAYQERKAASFCITPLFSGYSTGWTEGTDQSLQYNGFVPTVSHVKSGKGITVASAVAISGAAASPNMGFHSNTPMSFLMTVFNVRLGWWIRNPRRHAADSPRNGFWQLVKELTGSTTDTSKYVYLSDGGHFDNMGLYELLRRRCRVVIICDAEADSDLRFEGIGMALRKARVDFGIEVTVTRALGKAQNKTSNEASSPISPSMTMPSGAEGLLEFTHFPGNLVHALEGTIKYPEDRAEDCPAKLLYIKSTLTGDETVDILNYHREHPSFPFDSTADQFYTESQFESYRRLGEHILLTPGIRDWVNENVPSC